MSELMNKFKEMYLAYEVDEDGYEYNKRLSQGNCQYSVDPHIIDYETYLVISIKPYLSHNINFDRTLISITEKNIDLFNKQSLF